jgi:hypothetical protein
MKPLPYDKITRAFLAFWLLIALLVASQGGNLAAKASPAAQTVGAPEILANPPRVIYKALYVTGGSREHLMAPQATLNPDAPQLSTINVNYIGSWPAEAKAAFEYAKHIWEVSLSSSVPIVVNATWESMGANVLGSTAPKDAIRFSSSPAPGGALVNTWYPVALANKLGNKDYNPSAVDIDSRFNSTFTACPGGSNCWYFGTDGKVGLNQWDFASVVLHELAHGLGFAGSMSLDNSGIKGQWGILDPNNMIVYPLIFDLFAVNSQNQKLINTSLFPNPSTALLNQLTSNHVYFNGAHALAAAGGKQPQLYDPNPWQQGSSFSHLDESAYPASSGNALMTPYLFNGEVEHAPGPITLGIFQDLGWGLQTNLPPRTFLPLLNLNAGGRLYGQVTENGVKAPGVLLKLCRLNSPTDTNCTKMGSTATLADGTYAFTNMPSLQTGQEYLAYFQNTSVTIGRLWYWQTRSLVTYTLGSQVQLGNFDIGDIKLISPSSPVTVTLPVAFTWQVRSASLSDSYEFDLYELNSFSPYFYSQPLLGHVGSYQLKSLPTGFLANTRYVWEIWAYAPDKSFGISLESRPIAFTPSASASASSSPGEVPLPAASPRENVLDLAWR